MRLYNSPVNLIILTPSDAAGVDTFEISDERSAHIRNVLRSQVGDTLRVGIVDGPVGTATIVGISEISVRLEFANQEPMPLPTHETDVICALPRPQTLKKVLSLAATMQVRNLFLIRADRVEKSYYHSPLLQPDNYRRFLIEGLGQGKSTRLPVVTIHDRFRRFLEDELPTLAEKEESCRRLLPDPDSDRRLTDILPPSGTNSLIAIGPEGGWVPFEIEAMESIGFQRFCLGPWTLRVEQALTAALAQIELAQKR